MPFSNILEGNQKIKLMPAAIRGDAAVYPAHHSMSYFLSVQRR
jgi:hypothetical protein